MSDQSIDDILAARNGEQAAEPITQNAPPQDPPKDPPKVEAADSDEPEAVDVGGQKMVPHQALHAQKEKVKRYTEQVAEFEKSIGSVREQNAALTRQVTELLQRIPQPKQEQQAPPDFFENPQAATQHVAQQLVGPQFEQFNQALLANAQLVASVKYGDDKVAEAEQAFIKAVQSRSVDPADYQKVVGSPNRYAAAVQWHQRQLAQQEIGDDPVAFRAKVEAEILAKHGLTPDTNGTAQAQQQPVIMPSNLATARNVGQRAGPAWSGPPPIADIFNRKRTPA